jgi:hypothetical protein
MESQCSRDYRLVFEPREPDEPRDFEPDPPLLLAGDELFEPEWDCTLGLEAALEDPDDFLLPEVRLLPQVFLDEPTDEELEFPERVCLLLLIVVPELPVARLRLFHDCEPAGSAREVLALSERTTAVRERFDPDGGAFASCLRTLDPETPFDRIELR